MTDKALRDVAIFVAVMVLAGWSAVFINTLMQPADPMESLGVLVWLLVPPITAIVLSVFAGNWVQRLGLGLGSSGKGKWYLLAIVVTPAVSAIVMPVALLTGALKFAGTTEVGLGELAIVFLVSSALKNVFEEICWRGFLTPRLEETRFAGLPNHLITGVIWALWHIPYWLFFITAADVFEHTALPVWGMVVVAFFMSPLQAILYGELRLLTGSVWPAYVLHTISNVVTMVLLSGGIVVLIAPLGIVFSPGTSGILYSILLAVVGVWLYRRRTGGAKAVEGT